MWQEHRYMLRIAVCDDDITELDNITTIISNYSALQADTHQIESSAFQSAVDSYSVRAYYYALKHT